MDAVDGRKLSHDALEVLRLQALRRFREGERPSAIMKSFGFCRTTIYRWLRAAQSDGEAALRARKATGRPRTLTAKQEQRVLRWVAGKDPRQYGFDFGLWTRRIVAELIERETGARLSVNSVGRLLARVGVTPQKPLRRAYERDPVAIERWKRVEFPLLRARARQRGADIFFLDEAGIRSDAAPGRTWGVRGQTPIVPTTGQRQAVNAISAVTMAGGFWYNVYTGRLNATRFVEFLSDFLRRRRRPVLLVTDRHPAHIAKVVAEFIQRQRGRLELHFLPGYAPDLNPDEFVWHHIKTHGLSKKPLRRNESLRERVEQDLATLKRDPYLIRSLFFASSVAYIMD